VGALFLGRVGFLVAAIFGPLLFPATMSGTSIGENIVVLSCLGMSLAFCIGGFVICWKITQRFAKKENR